MSHSDEQRYTCVQNGYLFHDTQKYYCNWNQHTTAYHQRHFLVWHTHEEKKKINGYLTWKENIHWGEFTTTVVICSPEFVVCVYTCHTVTVNRLTQTLNWRTSCLLQWFQNSTWHHPERLIYRILIINLFLRVCFCSLWHVQWNSKTSWLTSGVE